MKNYNVFLVVGFVLFLIILSFALLDEDEEGVDYRVFYEGAIDYNEDVIELSRTIFENQKEIDLKTYELEELELEVRDLEYFEEKYDEYGPGSEKYSPSDKLSSADISVYGNRIIIELTDSAQIGSVADTGSMDPVLDIGSNTVKIKPKSTLDIEVGDIITYKPSNSEQEIIHRVIQISEDEEGWYVIAKGDNNPISDPERIRFDQITGVLIAIIY